MRTELLPEGHEWLRIAESSWLKGDPLDPSFAALRGGRWNPPDSFPTLYLNEDVVTARINLRHFVEGWPYEPEDLRNATGPVLVHALLPRKQLVADVHSREGVAAVKLPAGFPLDEHGRLVPHPPCQAIGLDVKRAGLRGVRARSGRAPDGAGRELAWFPATRRSHARSVAVDPFDAWYWGSERVVQRPKERVGIGP